MNEPRRIADPRSDATDLARDLVSAARTDGPPDGARARALSRLERALGADGVTTHISALSDAMAAGMLAVPSLTSSPLEHPRDASPAGRSRTILVSGFAAVAILAAGGVMVASLLRASPPARPTTVSASVRTEAGPSATTVATGAATASLPSAATTPALEAGTGDTPPALVAAAGGTSASSASHGAHASTGATHTSTAVHAATGSAGGGSVASSSGGGSGCAVRCHGDINCLLNCGTAGGGSGGGGGGGGGGRGGPETPARNDIASSLGALRGEVRGCGNGMTGIAWVNVTFSSSGRVTTATVEAPFLGTPAGSCIARAVRRASVPQFTRPTFSVRFPFSIH